LLGGVALLATISLSVSKDRENKNIVQYPILLATTSSSSFESETKALKAKSEQNNSSSDETSSNSKATKEERKVKATASDNTTVNKELAKEVSMKNNPTKKDDLGNASMETEGEETASVAAKCDKNSSRGSNVSCGIVARTP